LNLYIRKRGLFVTSGYRLDVHHEIMLLVTEKRLHHAPVAKNSHRVLDIGTGTGIWAIDYAYEHPEAEVIGMDLR
jgi:methylase of polypeptide subunit release factors